MPGVPRHAPRGGLGGAPQRGAPRIHRVGAAAHSESPPAAAPFSATLRSRMRCFFFSFFSRWYLVVRYNMNQWFATTRKQWFATTRKQWFATT